LYNILWKVWHIVHYFSSYFCLEMISKHDKDNPEF
jgi:hypothetical protein